MVGEWRDTIYGKVSADFSEDTLKELCHSESGIQTGPFGSQLHQEDYVSVGTPIITVEHLGENRILHDGVPRVSDADRDRLSRYLLQTGDIVFSRVGSVDRRALVQNAENGWLFSGRCLRVRPTPEKIDPGYLSYFFGLPAFKEHIRAIAVGATMPSLNTSLLSKVVIPHPPDIVEQRAIAHILGTLDDKIELNRRMSETLEAMARALFKSWFVDFDPVRAKMCPPSPSGRGAGGEGSVEGGSLHKPAIPANLLDFARQLRKGATDAESLVWSLLRNRSLAGLKFRRQHPVPPFVLDFYCDELKLAVELDGGQHNSEGKNKKDAARTEFLKGRGIRVLRFWNNEVLKETEAVLGEIYRVVTEMKASTAPSPPPPPLPGGEGGLPKEILDLFPSRLVDSELGEIPEGWEVMPFSDTVEIIGGGTPKTNISDFWNGDIPWFSVVDAPIGADLWVLDTEKKITRQGVENSSTRILPVGTTIISARGTVGRIALVGVPMAMNQSCYGLQGKSGHGGYFNYFVIREIVTILQQRAHGSIFDTITRDTLAGIPVLVPPSKIVDAFEIYAGKALERIRRSVVESQTLAALRDALLPKLISGELRATV